MPAQVTEARERARADTPPQVPAATALPAGWVDLWGHPEERPAHIEWARLRRLSRELAEEIDFVDHTGALEALVGSADLRGEPVHRWFSYKEGFSPRLLSKVIEMLGLEGELRVADAFGGVATTGLSGLLHTQVVEVRSVEYSPFARFAGQTKLQWPDLDPVRLRDLLPQALAYDRDRAVQIPDLAAFRNARIFAPERIRTLLRSRDHLRELSGCDQPECDFFLLGLAAVTEDLSGAIKDGRALRIKGGRTRRRSSLADTEPEVEVAGIVKRALAGQWTAMLSDLDGLAAEGVRTEGKQALHLPGDARELDQVLLDDGEPAFGDDWADLGLFSPPYLNCIDYTEVYKMELWLMGHITDQAQFRKTRLGTLRSHPSVQFPPRDYFRGETGTAVDLVRGIADWVQQHGGRPEVAPIVRNYFEDMLQVWREQYRILKSGACSVCVVANSTFSRRERDEDGKLQELWRLPLLTDVLLAHLARRAGFKSVEIWGARELRPRNVRGGRARESLVIARKA